MHHDAPFAQLDCLRVLGQDLRTSSQRVLEGLKWGLEQGYPLIHCSFGTTALQHLPEYKEVVDQAYCQNAWIVAASGALGRSKELPASFPSVFGVRMGPWADADQILRNPGALPEYQAAGQDIRCPWLGQTYRNLTGSSVAAPRLTALLARVRRDAPSMGLWEAKQKLIEQLPLSGPMPRD